MMNRPAKDGARSSLQYGGEGVVTHLSYQSVCERRDPEDLDVTPGALVVFPVCTEISAPIRRESKWERMRGEQSESQIVPRVRRKPRDRTCDRTSGTT